MSGISEVVVEVVVVRLGWDGRGVGGLGCRDVGDGGRGGGGGRGAGGGGGGGGFQSSV